MALRNGSRFGVSMHDVFPSGCHLLPDSIAEAMDYDEKTKTRRPAVDKVTGKRVWQCRVQDMDPDLAGRQPPRAANYREQPTVGTTSPGPRLCWSGAGSRGGGRCWVRTNVG